MTRSTDDAQRIEALDPLRSFIVEAPAGSGKTELLIQRFLKLLARVERPEQIIAITFTRKAAAEMRQRVLDTLKAATLGEAVVPAHRIQSLELAREVIAHAEVSGWSLIEQPRRLRILTIDSLNAALARRMPLLSNGIVSLGVADDTRPLYALAARRTTESLADSGTLGHSLRQMLAASDNSLRQLEHWLAGSLAQRDRWLREFHGFSRESLVERIESNLAKLVDQRLAIVRELVGSGIETQLFDLLARRDSDTPESSGDVPDPVRDSRLDQGQLLSTWREASRLLLTATGGWRKRYTRKEGFPAADKALHQALKSLLEVLHGTDGLHASLQALAALPEPPSSEAQREQLRALEQVLPRLLAELRVLFEESANVDHTELALAAQQALGAVDAPSDLLLALDRRIEHILVDEFQDTSHLQWRLLEQLTAGWQVGDGRSLFLVGDPMQSIYRFRDADLSLFLKARHDGLGGIDLHPIELRENHRSAQEIVDWVNSSFAGVFPTADLIETDVPAFRSAISSRPPDTDAGVALHLLGDTDYAAEIARAIDIVQNELKQDSARSIGILVRSRTHLAGMRAALKGAGLAAHAIEIDSLADTQLGQDLIGMTQALVHPGDRLSWLGLLRSPWCGLEWSDLLALCSDDSKRTIWERIAAPEYLARLSTEGSQRAAWLCERLRHGFALRSTQSFGRWIRAVWLAIDGPASLSDGAERDQAERFFCELESLAQNGDVDDPTTIRAHFATPGAGAEIPLESGIEIMTIHRAKGLEFDTVVLPGLGRVTRGNQSNLLLCHTFSLSNGERLGLVAAASATREPIFDYLSQIEREQDAAERGRLLYVAATRAKRRLHLIGSVDPKRATPKTGSLLATLWPGLNDRASIEVADSPPETSAVGFVQIPLRRLSFDVDLPALPTPPVGLAASAEHRPEFEWVRPASVQVGTLIHRELQRVADAARRANKLLAPEIDPKRFRRELALLGVEDEDLSSAADRVADALGKVWDDPIGRWILKPRPEAWSELRLTIRGSDRLEHVQLDRSFIDDDGQRWIIDYKTGRHLGSDVEQFLDAEVERYQGQLERYAQAVAETDQRPIRVGLYFPLMTELRDWKPQGLRKGVKDSLRS